MSDKEKVLTKEAIIDLLKRDPDLIKEALAEEEQQRKILPVEVQLNYIEEWREKVREMNRQQMELDGSKPFNFFYGKGSLCDPITGEPVCVITDSREGDMNLLGEKFHYGWIPAKNGILNDLLIEFGEGKELFRKIPKEYWYNEYTDLFEDWYSYEYDDMEWEYGDDLW